MTTATDPDLRTFERFRHEAFLYRGGKDFLCGTASFVRDALDAGEPILLAVTAEKQDALRVELGDDLRGRGDDVLFADMAELGRNPARIIPAWRDFLITHAEAGQRARGVGEPVWAGRSRAELLEAQRHEVLLGIAFTDLDDFWLLCPYDVEGLGADVVAEAYRSHAFIREGGTTEPSEVHRTLARVPPHLDDPLDPPPARAQRLRFGPDDLSDVRRWVAQRAAALGMGPSRSDMLVLAVNELTTNSIEHGGGLGELWLWRQDGAVVAEVRDGGYITAPLVGRVRPDQAQGGGRGVWLVNQVCDLVQIRSAPRGSVVRVQLSGAREDVPRAEDRR